MFLFLVSFNYSIALLGIATSAGISLFQGNIYQCLNLTGTQDIILKILEKCVASFLVHKGLLIVILEDENCRN